MSLRRLAVVVAIAGSAGAAWSPAYEEVTPCFAAAGAELHALFGQHVACDDLAEPISGFTLEKGSCATGEMRFRVRCRTVMFGGCTSHVVGDCVDVETELPVLTEFDVTCPAGLAVGSYELEDGGLACDLLYLVTGAKNGNMRYDCCLAMGYEEVSSQYTPCALAQSVDHLANFAVDCGEGVLRSFRLVESGCPANQMRFHYGCLRQVTLAPLTVAPPTAAPVTAAPPTSAPPTLAPATIAPPTLAPATIALAPPTNAPRPTAAPVRTEAPAPPPTGAPSAAPASAPPATLAANPQALSTFVPATPQPTGPAPGEASEGTTQAVAVGAASSMATFSTSGALGAGRLAILGAGCSDTPATSLPFAMHPTGLKFSGKNGIFVGCLAGNTAIVLSVSLAHVLLTFAVARLGSAIGGKLDGALLLGSTSRDGILSVQGLLRFPAWSLFFFFLLYQGFSACGAALLFSPEALWEVLLGLAAAFVTCGFPLANVRLVRSIVADRDTVFVKDPNTPRWLQVFIGAGEWVPVNAHVVNRFGTLFTRYVPRGVYFTSVECFLSLCLACIDVVPTSSLLQCGHKRLATLLALVFFFAVVLAQRPSKNRCADVVELVSHGVLAFGALALTLSFYSGERDHWGYTASARAMLVGSVILVVKGVLDTGALAYVVYTSRRARLLAGCQGSRGRKSEAYRPQSASSDSGDNWPGTTSPMRDGYGLRADFLRTHSDMSPSVGLQQLVTPRNEQEPEDSPGYSFFVLSSCSVSTPVTPYSQAGTPLAFAHVRTSTRRPSQPLPATPPTHFPVSPGIPPAAQRAASGRSRLRSFGPRTPVSGPAGRSFACSPGGVLPESPATPTSSPPPLRRGSVYTFLEETQAARRILSL
ncbi:hypothetical protein DIPPA_20240 [Diplonema papillatum]|nr:hypothetical protein DIPPA_20240 [Diplonema papillatum]